MNVYFENFQSYWYKFKRRAFQYSINALKNPKWFLMFCATRIQILRSWGIYFSKRPWYQISGDTNSIFKGVNADLVVQELRNEGLYIGINLPQDILSEIQDFSQTTSYLGNANNNLKFFLPNKDQAQLKYQQKFVTAHHLNPSSLCTAIQKIEKDPKLWEIAAKYLETNPILIETRLWWTFVVEEAVDKSLALPFDFHYDLEDYRFIKFMFYIKEVNKSSGPHVCVKGSHKKKKLKDQFSLVRQTTEPKILDYYGREKVETICGKSGLGFVEDFYCFHRGSIPISEDRLILGVKFAMNNYGVKF